MKLAIGARLLGDGEPPFLVAEAGLNHDGSLEQALEMVEKAAAAGVDAVKFGAFKASEFCRPEDPLYADFERCELPESAWGVLAEKCRSEGVVFFATPQNPSDLPALIAAGAPCIKVGSDDLTNTALIAKYASHGLPMILSAGMADAQEVRDAYYTAAQRGAHVVLLACTSEYPCPAGHANTARVATLRRHYPFVGYSDHTTGDMASIMATALGACYLERHFTLDRTLEGPDHRWSAEPAELARWVWSVAQARAVLGSGRIEPSPQELEARKKWRRRSGQQLRGETDGN